MPLYKVLFIYSIYSTLMFHRQIPCSRGLECTQKQVLYEVKNIFFGEIIAVFMFQVSVHGIS